MRISIPWVILGLMLPATLFPIVPNFDMVDTPTAVTMPKRAYTMSFTEYDEGGILTKAAIGLHDNIFLGAAFDIEHAIGREDVKMGIPAVIARAKITDGWDNFPLLIAVGYDSIYSHYLPNEVTEENKEKMDTILYGPHLTFTKPVFIGKMEQHFHLGVRMPVQPEYYPHDTSMYFAFDFPMGIFVPIIEFENIYFDHRRLREISTNLGFRFNIFSSLAFEFSFLMIPKRKVNRMLVIEFIHEF